MNQKVIYFFFKFVENLDEKKGEQIFEKELYKFITKDYNKNKKSEQQEQLKNNWSKKFLSISNKNIRKTDEDDK